MPTTSIASADSRQMMKRALPMIAAGHRADVGVDQARMVTRIVLILKVLGQQFAGGARQRRSKKSPHAAGFLGNGCRPNRDCAWPGLSCPASKHCRAWPC